jgi:lactate permease
MALVISLLPIVLILVLMIGLHWSAARAGAAGYLCSLGLAIAFFGATPELLSYAHFKALLFSLDVLIIVWAAFLFYRVSDEAGAIAVIGRALPRLTTDRSLQALMIGWVFASFLQGVGGFGVPVAVTSPILVGLGFSPLAAVIIPSIGHGWAVTFGSMGSAFQALLATTQLPTEILGPPSALLMGLAGAAGGVMIAYFLNGWREVGRLLVPLLAWGGVMAGAQYLVVLAGPWNIAAFTAGLAGLAITPLLTRGYHSGEKPKDIPSRRDLWVAVSAYVILIGITLTIQLIPPVQNFFGQVSVQAQFPEIVSGPGMFRTQGFATLAGVSRRINIFGHTGMLLIYASLLGYALLHRMGCYQRGAARRILGSTLRRVLPSSVSILSMIAMALIMEYSGMTDILARSLAEGAGGLFPFLSPWIGAVGAFMTGSNTNSNVVFGVLQMQTAELLHAPVALILAAQTASAGLASVAAPAKIVVGASTTSMAGQEGEVLRRLAGYTILFVTLIGVLAWLGVQLSAWLGV